ncbi:MAG: mannosyl-3-phosphoglycerate synthase, partial [Nitrososphaera sp.]
EFIDIFEKFGGLLPSNYPQVIDKGVEIFQIETRNPHFHEEKGVAHLNEMLEASLATIYRSEICPQDLKESILDVFRGDGRNSKKVDFKKKDHLMEPINTIDMPEFEKGVRDKADTFLKLGGLR